MDVPSIETGDSPEDAEGVGALDVESVSYIVAGPGTDVLEEPCASGAVDEADSTERAAGGGSGPAEGLREAIGEFSAKLERGLAELRTIVERDRRAEETREKIVDRLHAELQLYKEDLVAKMMRPIFLDLIHLHDDLGKRAEALGDGEAAGMLAEYQKEIEDILYRQGVEAYEAEGSSFDPRRQRAVTTVACEEPSLVKTVAARIRKGFASGDRIIRPESVSVYAARKG